MLLQHGLDLKVTRLAEESVVLLGSNANKLG